MTRNQTCTFLLSAMIALSCEPLSFAQSGCAPALPQDVCDLENQIYLNTDFADTVQVRGAMVGLKQLLISHIHDSNVIQDHILALVDQVLEEAHEVRAPQDILAQAQGQPTLMSIYDQLSLYQQHQPIVPLDWELPSDFMYFVFHNERSYSMEKDKTRFSFSIFGILKSDKVVEQVQVIRYPNDIVLDRQAGIGNWKDGHLGHSDQPTFSFDANDPTAPQKDGLYLLNVKVKNKPMVHGWFILTRTNPTETPIVRTPSSNEVFHTGKPTFHWVDYLSPEFQPFNQRKLNLSVRNRGPGANDMVWSSSAIDPDGSDTTDLSSAPNHDGATELTNGAYQFTVRFTERWFFGGLMIGRGARVDIPFSIDKR